jgi:hypothetical protein
MIQTGNLYVTAKIVKGQIIINLISRMGNTNQRMGVHEPLNIHVSEVGWAEIILQYFATWCLLISIIKLYLMCTAHLCRIAPVKLYLLKVIQTHINHLSNQSDRFLNGIENIFGYKAVLVGPVIQAVI